MTPPTHTPSPPPLPPPSPLPISLKYSEVERRTNLSRKGRPRTWYGGGAEIPSAEDEELRRSNSLEDFAMAIDEGSDDESLASGMSLANSKEALLQTMSSLTEKESRTESFVSSISDGSVGKESDIESEHGDDYEHGYAQEDNSHKFKGIEEYERILEREDEYTHDENEGHEETVVRDIGDVEVHGGNQEDRDEVVEEHKDVDNEETQEHEQTEVNDKSEEIEDFETRENPDQITAGSNFESGDVESEFEDRRQELNDSQHKDGNTQHECLDDVLVHDPNEHEVENSEHECGETVHEYKDTEPESKDPEQKCGDTGEESVETGGACEDTVAKQDYGETERENEDRNNLEHQEIENGTEAGTHGDIEENLGDEGAQEDNHGKLDDKAEAICNGVEGDAREPEDDEGPVCSQDKDVRNEDNENIDTSEEIEQDSYKEDLAEGLSNHNEELQQIEEERDDKPGFEEEDDSVGQSSHGDPGDLEVAQDLAKYKEIGESQLPNETGSITSVSSNENPVVEETSTDQAADDLLEVPEISPYETSESEGVGEESGGMSAASEDRRTEGESLSRESENNSAEREDRPAESDDQSEVKDLPAESDVGSDDLANGPENVTDDAEDQSESTDDCSSVKIKYEDINDIECEVEDFCLPGQSTVHNKELFRIQATDDVEPGEDLDHGRHIRFDEKALSESPVSEERPPKSPEDPFSVPMRDRSALLLGVKHAVKRSGSDASVTSLQDVELDMHATNREGNVSPGLLNSSRKAKSYGDLSTFSEGRSEMTKIEVDDSDDERRRIQEDHTVGDQLFTITISLMARHVSIRVRVRASSELIIEKTVSTFRT